MNIFLSYPLDPKDLAWPGEPTIKVRQATQIGVDGLPFNSFMSELAQTIAARIMMPQSTLILMV